MMDQRGVVRVERPVLRVARNTRGRDFVAGDLHGEFTLLENAMAYVQFDVRVDRMFCVGDQIDRGAESHRATEWMDKPWYFAVSGNHEQDHTRRYPTVDHEPLPQRDRNGAYYDHDPHGYNWWSVVSRDDRQAMLDAFKRLPLIIEVETDHGLVGLVHADVAPGLSWQAFVADVETGRQDMVQVALGISRSGRSRRLNQYDTSGVRGVYRVFTGHTNVPTVMLLGNVIAMDTAAVFRGRQKRNAQTGAIELLRPNAALSVIELTADDEAIRNIWMSKAHTPEHVLVAARQPEVVENTILALARRPAMRESFAALAQNEDCRLATS